MLLFKKSDPVNFDIAFNQSGIHDLNIIANISENIRLFTILNESGCDFIVGLDDALHARSIVNEDVLLLHFAELDLYGLFTIQQHYVFIELLNDAKGENMPVRVNMWQLVSGDYSHNFAFVCKDIRHFSRLQNHARKYFGTGTSTAGDQISVNFMPEDDTEAYDKFRRYVQSCKDGSSDAMAPIAVLIANFDSYRRYRHGEWHLGTYEGQTIPFACSVAAVHQ